MALQFSFIIPVYNRPDEVQELLESFMELEGKKEFEIVIVEDGSTLPSKSIVEAFNDTLHVSYYFKENSGPGDSRNYGMRKAKGNYFIILDSDCILPPQYLTEVKRSLNEDYVDCFGGPDAAHHSFTNLQKAVNFSMTSFLTTGGIRGGKKHLDTFQPRSFNMGLSKKAFEASGGFGRIHPGEDPDLSIRLWDLGYRTKLISKVFVYHKRRISWQTFYKQVNKFGLVRPILNKWHPSTKKITYWFPTCFSLGLIASIVLLGLDIKWPIFLYVLYFLMAFVLGFISEKNVKVALLVIPAIIIQFFGYGIGFLKSTIVVFICKRAPEVYFPKLFFEAP
ncbi:glycosyltransferase [Tamlana fucoidanivorans]|uniref:Glycosyltransferase n=1 Tax=Allotamlana fucoidanivorans TaxID=2583814 RepID=A0A5C4SJ23_9FLAO|nr:glycosyltransferase [Tamlana fucoidanivorans]TNJ43094.1 glycosyltransferase [Tamlana fucoidanivorans]